jgi:putative peptidoglycan lipid II flippase
MVASLFLSRILGLVRDMVMSGQFGAGAAADAYRLSFQVPDLLFFLVAGGALSSAFIPVFSEYWHTDRRSEAWHVFSAVVTVMSTAVLAACALAWIWAGPLAQALAPGKSPAEIEVIAYLSRIVLPAQFAFLIGGLMFGTLYARQVFAVPGLGPNVYNLGIIFGALVISQFVFPPISGMSWGATLGAIVGNLLIPLWALQRMGWEFRPSFDVRHPGVAKVFRLMLPVVLGLSLPGVYGLIMQYFGSFYQTGVNAALSYANLLMQAPLGVFGQSLALAAFPALAQFFAQSKEAMFKDQLERTLRTTLYLSLPVTALFLAAAPTVVAAIYRHGAFTQADTDRVAWLLQLFAIGVWAWCLHPVLMRAFFARHDSVTPIVIGTVTTGVFFALCQILRSTDLSYGAMPLAGSLSAIVLVGLLMVVLARRLGGLDFAALGTTFAKASLASAAFGAVSYGLLQLPLAQNGGVNKLASVGLLLAMCLPGAWLYYGLTRWMRMPETDALDRAFGRINRKLGITRA